MYYPKQTWIGKCQYNGYIGAQIYQCDYVLYWWPPTMIYHVCMLESKWVFLWINSKGIEKIEGYDYKTKVYEILDICTFWGERGSGVKKMADFWPKAAKSQ